jgi:Ribbon-helix-helix protein, copG family
MIVFGSSSKTSGMFSPLNAFLVQYAFSAASAPHNHHENALLEDRKSADRLNTMASRKVQVSLTLSSDILKEVDRQAAIAKVSRSAYIEAVLRQYLSDQEHLARIRKD